MKTGWNYLGFQTSISKIMILSVKPSVLYENRYCNQDEFDIVVLEKLNKSTN